MERFFLSDHHFRHQNIYKMLSDDGTRVRPWAESPDEADEMMIDAHNAMVGVGDKTYFMGDVSMNKHGLLLLPRMNGKKVLIRGNHDTLKAKQYLEHFDDILSMKEVGCVMFSHYPLHTQSFPHCVGNAHGHMHEKLIMLGDRPDPRFLSICVEIAGIVPVPYDDIEMKIRKNLEDYGAEPVDPLTF